MATHPQHPNGRPWTRRDCRHAFDERLVRPIDPEAAQAYDADRWGSAPEQQAPFELMMTGA